VHRVTGIIIIIIIIIKGIYIAQVRKGHKCALLCLYVCPLRAYLQNHTFKLYQISFTATKARNRSNRRLEGSTNYFSQFSRWLFLKSHKPLAAFDSLSLLVGRREEHLALKSE